MANEKENAISVDHNDDMHDTVDAVQLAHEVETKKSSPWTLPMFRLYLVLTCAYLCGCLVCSPCFELVQSEVLTIVFGRTATMAPSWEALTV